MFGQHTADIDSGHGGRIQTSDIKVGCPPYVGETFKPSFLFFASGKTKNETNIKNKLYGFYFPKILVRPNVRISDMTVC